jgi:hypothetical protein
MTMCLNGVAVQRLGDGCMMIDACRVVSLYGTMVATTAGLARIMQISALKMAQGAMTMTASEACSIGAC